MKPTRSRITASSSPRGLFPFLNVVTPSTDSVLTLSVVVGGENVVGDNVTCSVVEKVVDVTAASVVYVYVVVAAIVDVSS